MPPLNFPNNPAHGDTFLEWEWDGTAWVGKSTPDFGTTGSGAFVLQDNPTINGIVRADGRAALYSSPTLRPAVVNPIPQRLAGTVMCGLNIAFIPHTTRVLIVINGSIAADEGANAAGQTGNVSLRFGDGSPPAQGAALVGTVITGGVQFSIGSTAGNLQFPCGLVGVADNLIAGLQYWTDVAIATSAGTANYFNAYATIVEL